MQDADTEEDRGSSDKPRRLEEDIFKYLQQLEPQINNSNLESSEKDVLVTNILTEIKSRVGSAMCDRRTNLILENLCFLSSLSQIITICTLVSPYAVFLARNRHSSHVLQALISRLCYLLKFQGVKDVDTDLIRKTIIAFTQPILKEIKFLSKDMNGSHVLRSVICLLAGIPTISERKVETYKTIL